LDIGQIELDGVPFAWISNGGYASSSYYEPQLDGWQRNFFGGLLTTCGLTQVGEPCQDEGELLGLHGRISNTPATRVGYEEEWDGDDYLLRIKGCVQQFNLFSENLELHRKIETTFGSNRLTIRDKVVNKGYKKTPLMLLYHINLGFPLINSNATIVCSPQNVSPWAGTPNADIINFFKIPEPSLTIDEEVIELDILPDDAGYCTIGLINPDEELGFYIKFKKEQFPKFCLWKGIREGIYAIGFEPGNCGVNGRSYARQNGELDYLSPLEERIFEMELVFLNSKEEINEFNSMFQ
jgi:hypothetical protein